jgi:histidinol-phosphate aminotransferase
MVVRRDLRVMLEAAPETAFVVDEAYHEFSGETIIPWIGKYSNLIVTRTFSKAFGLAALRMGCIITNAQIAELMRRGQNPFSANSIALAGALAAIEHADYTLRFAAQIRTERERLQSWLDTRGIPCVPSKANFILAQFGPNSPEVGRRLRAKKILVRDWNYDPRLRGFLRITVGSGAQMRVLRRELTQLRGLMEIARGRRAKFSAPGEKS